MANTTADKLQYLLEANQLIKEAIIAKVVEVSDDTPLKEYAEKISQIQTGIDTSNATAEAEDIKINKTAYARGEEVVGTFDVMTSEIPEIGGTLAEAENTANEILGEILGE